MARNVTSAAMLARVRYITDTEVDTHVSNAEIYSHLTTAVAKTWDTLLANGLGGEGVKTVYFSTVSGQTDYAINTIVPALDFYKVKTLYVNDGTGLYRPVHRTNPNEEYALKGPQAVIGMKLCYIPCAPVFSTGLEVFDGINGWEEHTIQLAAVEIKKKKEEDAGRYTSGAREVEERMKSFAMRSNDEPPRVVRRRKAQAWANRIAPYAGGVYAWDIRGANIELYAPSLGLYL